MKRKFLTDLGITDNEVIDKIINTYQAGVSDIKDELTSTVKGYEAKIQELSKDEITPKLAELQTKYDELETKYNTDIKAKETEFNTFKTDIETKELKQTKTNLLKQSLEKDGANPKLLDLLMKAIDVDSLELDTKTNALKNYEDISKSVKENYKDIFSTTTIVTNADNPITNNGTVDKATDYRNKLTEARKTGNTQEAVRIKTEASTEGVILI